MSNESTLSQPAKDIVLDTSNLPASSSASVWDRISKWVSENKAIVYTVAGVAVVVTGAGVVYYLSDSNKSAKTSAPSPTEKKKSKNQRRKEKKKAEEEKKAKTASVQDGILPPSVSQVPGRYPFSS